MLVSANEQALGLFLRDLPYQHDYRYTLDSDRRLREHLFRSLTGNDERLIPLFFPAGLPRDARKPWRLREAQGAVEGAEYTAAARGRPCGHIFRTGESTYHCKTCAADDTCVLCARCFTESDHEGHVVYISVSPGNSGCCDCADDEAWVRPVHCSVHRADPQHTSRAAGKTPQPAALPDELVHLVRMTIGRAIDYLNDVFSCSPEQLRLPKTELTVKRDELYSRLTSDRYGGPEHVQEEIDYALILWNDEKHTVQDVQNQVARACHTPKSFGLEKANEVNDHGRSIVAYSTNLAELLHQAAIIEQIKVTVTVRSARDTFRERMCDTVVDWIADIAGCSVGSDPHLLRNTICEELLKPWRVGSAKLNVDVGQFGIHDHEDEDQEREREAGEAYIRLLRPLRAINTVRINAENDDMEQGPDDDDDLDFDDEDDVDREQATTLFGQISDLMDVVEDGGTIALPENNDIDMDVDDNTEDGANEALEATLAGYPPPPLPPTAPTAVYNPNESDEGEASVVQPLHSSGTATPRVKLPRTPRAQRTRLRRHRPPRYWLETPEDFAVQSDVPPAENLWERVRLDYLILYDLRLWKTLRVSLRHLYIGTVVTIPEFKRILGLRFAGLYTMLAQLYLIADREPDHSIINLSVQMLTTPSITAEVVDRGNFLTNLMAILYTFLTTRQVGYPTDVNTHEALAFDAGAVTNRRMFHFFNDIKYMFQSAFAQEKIRAEPRYMLQFLDLVRLHQGLCPNVRAVGEHVEYENDTWISASMIIKEVNRLCRQIAEAFVVVEDSDKGPVRRAIRDSAHAALINSLALERRRFIIAEIKKDVRFMTIHPFSLNAQSDVSYRVPDFRVIKEPMSFHHPLHYLLSWLLEAGRSMPCAEVQKLLHFSGSDLKQPWMEPSERGIMLATQYTSEELLSVLFDYPLRVCAWLAQMRAGMWVRNGMTLRHQMHTYRGTLQRDVSYQRDLFMLQAGLVLCHAPEEPRGERFLAQMMARFDMINWVRGMYSPLPGFEENQQLDVVEDFFHLLVVLLSERSALSPLPHPAFHKKSLEREIAHALCFKPLSYSEITARLTDRVADAEEFDAVLEEMTNFRAPEGLSDSGTFELHAGFVEMIDPYYAFYSRNQREEAETLVKAHMAKKTARDQSEMVYEPKLFPIASGLFQGLADFTKTTLFAQLVFSTLGFACSSDVSSIAPTRIETFLHVVLHLIVIAVDEDSTSEEDRMDSENSFVKHAVTPFSGQSSILTLLLALLSADKYSASHPRIKLINQRLEQKRPRMFTSTKASVPNATSLPATPLAGDREAKKKQALDRQAKVMAQFKQQQSSFMETQGLDWDVDDLSDEESSQKPVVPADLHTAEKSREYPSEPCMLCQEETNHGDRLFGTFAFISKSRIDRQTDLLDADYIAEVLTTPSNLDRSAEAIRPFGVVSSNKHAVQKRAADGSVVIQHQQGLSKGFPQGQALEGPVATSCGHIMHFSCFEAYLAATDRRHSLQIARNHPERPKQKEFLCPLCKALGNTFLPIIWKAKTESYPGVLASDNRFEDWLGGGGLWHSMTSGLGKTKPLEAGSVPAKYFAATLVPAMASSVLRLSIVPPSVQQPITDSQKAFQTLSSLLNWGIDRRGSQASGPGESSTPAATIAPAQELDNAYQRLYASVENNAMTRIPRDSSLAAYIDCLCSSLGLSISAVEIAQRGNASFPSLLAAIPEHSLTHLRILSETVTSVTQLGSLQETMTGDLLKMQYKNLLTLVGDSHASLSEDDTSSGSTLLFASDIFIFLTKCLVVLGPAAGTYHHMIRVCYMAEVVKVVVAFFDRRHGAALAAAHAAHAAVHAEGQVGGNSFVRDIMRFVAWTCRDVAGDSRTSTFGESFGEQLCAPLGIALEKYASVFLRKALLLLHVRFGVDFEGVEAVIDHSAPEIDRLAGLLQLPSLNGMLEEFLSDSPAGEAFRSLATTWIQQALPADESPPLIRLSHPAIFELVGLPKTYDTLTEEALRRRCPTTGKEVSDPAVCLFCGDIFCSQASCCNPDGKRGGCSQHLKKCGGTVGIFIHIRKCMVLFMHDGHGSWAHAPYLDRHGEVDPTLRRHHQLFLNQRRYDKLLRDVWLNHGVPSAISRRLEGDINTGGWETL